MINLLPYDQKKHLAAARTNTVLLRYNVILVAAALFLVGAFGVAYAFLASAEGRAQATMEENSQKEQNYSKTKTAATEFQTKLGKAKTVFDSEISYSRALVRFGELFPSGTAVSEMKLSEESFSKPLEMTVLLNGESAANRLTESLEKSPYVSNFQKKSVSYNDTGSYRYSWDISFTLSKEIAKQ